MIIYKITNIINNKPYIGYTKTTIKKRWNRHITEFNKGTNRKLYDAMRKYGIENFIIEEIDKDDFAMKEDWLHLETFYIIVYDSVDNGYNMTYGGIGGDTWSGKSTKGKTCYDKWLREFGKEEADRRKTEMYKKVSKANKENPPHTIWSDEQRKAMSVKAKELNWMPPHHVVYGKDHQFFGKTHTNKSKEKISMARLGKTYEQCMPKETADRLKEYHREKFIGNGNPNYIDIPKEILYDLIVNQRKNNKEISDIFNVTRPTIIEKSKKYFGVTPSKLTNENKT